MTGLIRALAYIIGVAYWLFMSIPRYDVERRSSKRYRKGLRITKNIWIGSLCLMLVIMTAFPTVGLAVSIAQALLTAFVCYMILDEIE